MKYLSKYWLIKKQSPHANWNSHRRRRLSCVERGHPRCRQNIDRIGWEVLGIEEGFDGLVHCRTRPMTAASVSGILHLGGTILGTTNAGNPFTYPVRENGVLGERDISDTCLSNFRRWGSMR